MLKRLAYACYRRRGRVVVAWILGLVILGVLRGTVGNGYRSDFTLPDVESKRGIDILDERFGGQGAGQVGNIVFRAEQGVDDPAVREGIEPFLAVVAGLDNVQSVTSPYQPGGERQISQNGQIAYAEVEAPFDASFEETAEVGRQIRAAIPDVEGVRVELGGAAFAEFEVPSSEALGIGFAIIILIIAFGSVLAMGLPIGVALAGIMSGTALGSPAVQPGEHAGLR